MSAVARGGEAWQRRVLYLAVLAVWPVPPPANLPLRLALASPACCSMVTAARLVSEQEVQALSIDAATANVEVRLLQSSAFRKPPCFCGHNTHTDTSVHTHHHRRRRSTTPTSATPLVLSWPATSNSMQRTPVSV